MRRDAREGAFKLIFETLFKDAEEETLNEVISPLKKEADITVVYKRMDKDVLFKYGIMQMDGDGRILDFEEKPLDPPSRYAVPGLYFYDNDAVELAKRVGPSARGELEITCVNSAYLERGRLHVELLGPGITWLDTGSPPALLKAAAFVERVQAATGRYVACIEEIAWRQGFIGREQRIALGEALSMTDYGRYLISCGEGETHD